MIAFLNHKNASLQSILRFRKFIVDEYMYQMLFIYVLKNFSVNNSDYI